MARGRTIDRELLEAALVGLEQKKTEVDQKIGEVRRMLGGRALRVATKEASVKPKRTLSAAARQRIAAAQRKRWAAVKKAQEAQRTVAKAVRRPIRKPSRKQAAQKKTITRPTMKKLAAKKTISKKAPAAPSAAQVQVTAATA